MKKVQLDIREYAHAVDVGMQRMVASTEAGHNHASTYERDWLERLEQETVGACAELAFCKFMGWYWSGSVNTFHTIADAGRDVEVRSTTRDDGSLIIRNNDADDRWYVLVTGKAPVLTIRGRIKGGEGKKPEWARDPHGRRRAWFVPQAALEDI